MCVQKCKRGQEKGRKGRGKMGPCRIKSSTEAFTRLSASTSERRRRGTFETITGLVTHVKKRKGVRNTSLLISMLPSLQQSPHKTDITFMFLSIKFKGTFNSWDQMKIDDLELLTTVAPEVKDGPLICTTSSKDPRKFPASKYFVFFLGPLD